MDEPKYNSQILQLTWSQCVLQDVFTKRHAWHLPEAMVTQFYLHTCHSTPPCPHLPPPTWPHPPNHSLSSPGLLQRLFPFINQPFCLIHCVAHPAGSHHDHWAPPSNKWVRTPCRLSRPPAERSARNLLQQHRSVSEPNVPMKRLSFMSDKGSSGWIMEEPI